MPMPKLEVFETEAKARSGSSLVVTEEGVIEEGKLAAYEQGYQAGWDDAAAAQAEDQGRIKTDLSRSLQALAFTYQEARGHILRALEPLLMEMATRVLPAIAHETLAPMVLEQVMPLAEELSDHPVSLVLNPAVRPAVEGLIEQATGLPLTIQEEPTLPEGQVYLRMDAAEQKVDLSRVLTEITEAVRTFFTLAQEGPPHG